MEELEFDIAVNNLREFGLKRALILIVLAADIVLADYLIASTFEADESITMQSYGFMGGYSNYYIASILLVSIMAIENAFWDRLIKVSLVEEHIIDYALKYFNIYDDREDKEPDNLELKWLEWYIKKTLKRFLISHLEIFFEWFVCCRLILINNIEEIVQDSKTLENHLNSIAKIEENFLTFIISRLDNEQEDVLSYLMGIREYCSLGDCGNSRIEKYITNEHIKQIYNGDFVLDQLYFKNAANYSITERFILNEVVSNIKNELKKLDICYINHIHDLINLFNYEYNKELSSENFYNMHTINTLHYINLDEIPNLDLYEFGAIFEEMPIYFQFTEKLKRNDYQQTFYTHPDNYINVSRFKDGCIFYCNKQTFKITTSTGQNGKYVVNIYVL